MAVPVVVAALVAGLLASLTTATLAGGPSAASAAALTDIPPGYLRLYQQAAARLPRPGLDRAGRHREDRVRPRPLTPARRHHRAKRGRGRRADAAARAHLRHRSWPATRCRPAVPARRRGMTRTTPSTPPPTTCATTAPPPTCARRSSPTTTPPPTSPTSSPKPPPTARPAPIRTPWPTEQATVPDPSGTGGHVTPRTAALYRALAAAGRDPRRRHLLGPAPAEPRQRPPARQSLRPVLPTPTTPPTSPAAGTSPAWLTAHQAVYGVHYLIWQGLIWTAEHPPGRPTDHDLRLPEPGQPHRLPLQPHTFLVVLIVTIIRSDDGFVHLMIAARWSIAGSRRLSAVERRAV